MNSSNVNTRSSQVDNSLFIPMVDKTKSNKRKKMMKNWVNVKA